MNLGFGFGYAYGCEFSPDGTKLYGARELAPSVYQWDICATSSAAIVASQNTVATATGALELGAFQLAANNKIYIARYNDTCLATIDNPNVYGSGCNYVNKSQGLMGKKCMLGLPNFVSSFFSPPPAPFTYTASCNETTFTAPTATSASAGCTSTVNAGTYHWNFGDAASGPANTSTLSNPVHNFSSSGTYTVKLAVMRPCGADTLKQVITTSSIQFTASGTATICAGNSTTLTAMGASTYSWDNGMQGPKIVVKPTAPTYYIVYAFNEDSSCKAHQILHVQVLKCTGIEENEEKSFIAFPNPNTGKLTIENALPGTLELFDQLGKMVLRKELPGGNQVIDIAELSPGFYYLRYSNSRSCKTLRLEKTE